MQRVVKTMGPLLLLCRLADGQKPVISKLYGTQLHVREQIESVAAAAGRYTHDTTYILYIYIPTDMYTRTHTHTYTGADSVEQKILAVFLTRWDEIQSDIISETYLLDPLFVDQSKRAAVCTIKLWQLARKVIYY